MGRVRYKAPSENFEKITSTKEKGSLRSSIGKEQFIGEYYFIPVDSLLPYSLQARRIFDETEINQLASTIKEHGIKSPLLVIPSAHEVEKFEVISGERRLRAAKLIGMEKVPCIIIDQEKASEIALIENIQRSNLHPVELGDALNSLLEKSNWGDVTKLADKLGKSQSTISNYLAYSKFPPVIKKHLLEKNISSRPILRKILKCRSIEEMEEILGIRTSDKVIAQKSILRINVELGKLTIQDRALYKLNFEQREELKNVLKELLTKIENMENQR